jgi:hypothetical protein
VQGDAQRINPIQETGEHLPFIQNRDYDIHPFQRLRWKNIFGANPCPHRIILE